jgi:diketogulonate reductase-like aldo/keto reductase
MRAPGGRLRGRWGQGEAQLRANLGAVGWSLSQDQIARLDTASRRPPAYPFWHQMGFDERNPKPTQW